MLVHRPRRWSNIKSTLLHRLVFSVIACPSKHKTSIQCRINVIVGPPSTTLAQQWSDLGLTLCVWCDRHIPHTDRCRFTRVQMVRSVVGWQAAITITFWLTDALGRLQIDSKVYLEPTITSDSIPAHTRHWPNVGLMLGQRLRRWFNIKLALGQFLMLGGIRACLSACTRTRNYTEKCTCDKQSFGLFYFPWSL